MDKPPDGIGTNYPKKPQDQKYDSDCDKHIIKDELGMIILQVFVLGSRSG